MVVLFDVVHQTAILGFVYDGDDLLADLVIICTDTLINGGTAVKVIEDILEHLIMPVGQDADTALNIQTENKMIHQQTTKISSQHTDNHRGLVIEENRGKGHQHTGGRHGLAQLHTQILVHQFCHNIQSAGGGITGKHQGKSDTHNQDIADGIQQEILRDRLKIREKDLIDAQDSGQQNGCKNRFGTELRSDQQKTDDQQGNIDHKGNDRNRKGKKILMTMARADALPMERLLGSIKK